MGKNSIAMTKTTGLVAVAAASIAFAGVAVAGQRKGAQRTPANTFVVEATIRGTQAALRAGTITCVQLAQSYLDRIKAYDDDGPGDEQFLLASACTDGGISSVAGGASMPPVEGCHKQDYAVLIVIGVAVAN